MPDWLVARWLAGWPANRLCWMAISWPVVVMLNLDVIFCFCVFVVVVIVDTRQNIKAEHTSTTQHV